MAPTSVRVSSHAFVIVHHCVVEDPRHRARARGERGNLEENDAREKLPRGQLSWYFIVELETGEKGMGLMDASK